MVKHSLGPWTHNNRREIYDARGYFIAETCGAANAEQADANDALIAAAPDLLAALQAMVCNMDLAASDKEGLIEHTEAMRQARAAIRKAMGGAA